MDHARRLKWVKAVKRKNWMPTVHSRICGDHFVSGMYVSFPCGINGGIERLSFTVFRKIGQRLPFRKRKQERSETQREREMRLNLGERY